MKEDIRVSLMRAAWESQCCEGRKPRRRGSRRTTQPVFREEIHLPVQSCHDNGVTLEMDLVP